MTESVSQASEGLIRGQDPKVVYKLNLTGRLCAKARHLESGTTEI